MGKITKARPSAPGVQKINEPEKSLEISRADPDPSFKFLRNAFGHIFLGEGARFENNPIPLAYDIHRNKHVVI